MYWIATRTLPPVKFDPCAVSFMVEVAYQAVGPTTPLLLEPAAIPRLEPNFVFEELCEFLFRRGPQGAGAFASSCLRRRDRMHYA